jgi:ABC-type branched-subunit amino acid transport system ATPase component
MPQEKKKMAQEICAQLVLMAQNALMALRLARTAYVLEIGKIALEFEAAVIAGDE